MASKRYCCDINIASMYEAKRLEKVHVYLYRENGIIIERNKHSCNRANGT